MRAERADLLTDLLCPKRPESLNYYDFQAFSRLCLIGLSVTAVARLSEVRGGNDDDNTNNPGHGGGVMFRAGEIVGGVFGGVVAALAAAAVTAVASPAMAAPGCVGVSGVGSSGGPANAAPWLNGNTGGLPGLSGRTTAIEKVTGTYSPNKTVDRFNVLGTDLGIMWDNGAGQILTAFGDTTGLSRNPRLRRFGGRVAKQCTLPQLGSGTGRRYAHRQRADGRHSSGA